MSKATRPGVETDFIIRPLSEIEDKIGYEFQHKHLVDEDAVIAGGAVRDFLDNNKPPKDIDIFFLSGGSPTKMVRSFIKHESMLIKAGYIMKNRENSPTPTYEAVSLPPVQLILRDNPEQISVIDLLESFDFTVSQCAVFIENGLFMIAMSKHTKRDITCKELRYDLRNLNGIYPLNSLMRFPRYLKYGYTIDREQLYKIAKHVVETKGESGGDEYEEDECKL